MTHIETYSPQRDYFLGAIGLLVVAALASAFMGSSFGFIALGTVGGLLCTRAPWARIVGLVIVAYSAFVAVLIGIFGRGTSSLEGFVAAPIFAAIFWLLVRPGMNHYFGGRSQQVSQVLPVAPRPGALPHLQQPQASSTSIPPRQCTSAESTEQQWQRLQHQLRAEQEKEAKEAEFESSPARKPFPWLTLIITMLIYADAAALAGPLGRFSSLIAIPAFLFAMFRWINPRLVLLAILLLSGVLVVTPEHAIVFSGIHTLVQHQGPAVFAVAALLLYVVALCASGFAGECETA